MTSAVPAASPLSVSSVAQLTLSLIAIVALILAISWVLKRLKLAGPRGRGEISVLDQLTLGPRERILLVRVGDSQVLLGIGAGTLVCLTPLAANISLGGAAGGAADAPTFADRLRDLMKGPGSQK